MSYGIPLAAKVALALAVTGGFVAGKIDLDDRIREVLERRRIDNARLIAETIEKRRAVTNG